MEKHAACSISRGDGKAAHRAVPTVLWITILAIVIRLAGFPLRSSDYDVFLSPWIQYLRENGHFLGIVSLETDYAAPYLYLLSLISYLPSALSIYALKAVQCVFDFICARYAGEIVAKVSGSERLGRVAYCAVLLAPTVILNGAVWGQCDAVYTALLLVMFWGFLENRPRQALIFFGLALSLKLQSVFLLPFVIYLYIDKRFKLYEAVYSVLAFLAVQIPAWALGLPFTRSFGIYLTQTTQYGASYTLNAPSIYAFILDSTENELASAILVLFGIAGAIGLCGALALFICKAKRKLSGQSLILLFLFCGLVIPFLLPRMHERYFFIADIAVILFVCLKPKNWWTAILVTFPSCITYLNFLLFKKATAYDVIPLLPALALLVGTAAVLVSKWLVESILGDPKRIESGETAQRAARIAE